MFSVTSSSVPLLRVASSTSLALALSSLAPPVPFASSSGAGRAPEHCQHPRPPSFPPHVARRTHCERPRAPCPAPAAASTGWSTSPAPRSREGAGSPRGAGRGPGTLVGLMQSLCVACKRARTLLSIRSICRPRAPAAVVSAVSVPPKRWACLGPPYHGALSLAGELLKQLGQPVQCAPQRVEGLLLRHRAQRLCQLTLPLGALCAGAAAQEAQSVASIQLPPSPRRPPLEAHPRRPQRALRSSCGSCGDPPRKGPRKAPSVAEGGALTCHLLELGIHCRVQDLDILGVRVQPVAEKLALLVDRRHRSGGDKVGPRASALHLPPYRRRGPSGCRGSRLGVGIATRSGQLQASASPNPHFLPECPSAHRAPLRPVLALQHRRFRRFTQKAAARVLSEAAVPSARLGQSHRWRLPPRKSVNADTAGPTALHIFQLRGWGHGRHDVL